MVPCLLELGGKSPAIVDASADVSYAAKKILFGKMPNLGQICVAPDYIYCHESKVQQFIDCLRENLATGYNDGKTPADSGKIINEFHYERLCDLLKDHGGEVVIGNKDAAVDRNLQPTLILNPSKDAQLMKEEIFGPIFPLIPYKDIGEAIKYITEEQEKPLVLYYFGKRNGPNQQRLLDETSSGAFVVNDTTVQLLNCELPFGGVGHSGQGRAHGYAGFKQFSNMKSVLVKPSLDMFPFNQILPPYTDAVKADLLKNLKYGGITQAQMCHRLFWFIFIITAVILAIVYWSALGSFFTKVGAGTLFDGMCDDNKAL